MDLRAFDPLAVVPSTQYNTIMFYFVLFVVSHFIFLFVPCGGLGWLPVSFVLHVKYTLSYVTLLMNVQFTMQYNTLSCTGRLKDRPMTCVVVL